MTREEAVELLVRRDLAELSPEKRESLLLSWWCIDAADSEYSDLPDLLKEVMASTEQPDDPKDPLYDPLLKIALKDSYKGVLNSYLQRQIAVMGYREAIGGGVEEELEACPCCGYRSLRKRGEYEICRVCFWEDDGTTTLDGISGPNHMTLRDAQLNFRHLGAVDERARQYVLPDGKERYASIDIH
jgi:hypothetical protein